PRLRSTSRFVRASPRTSADAASRYTSTSTSRSSNVRATTKPSPPLLPRPHNTATRIASSDSNVVSIAATTWRPAFSINTIDGSPTSSIVRRSASRICRELSTLTSKPSVSLVLDSPQLERDGLGQRTDHERSGRRDTSVRSRVSVRRGRIRNTAHVPSRAVLVRAARGTPPQILVADVPSGSFFRRGSARRDERHGGGAPGWHDRGVHSHPAHARRRRADIQPGCLPHPDDGDHRQAVSGAACAHFQ